MEVQNTLDRLIKINSVFGNEAAIGRHLELKLRKMGFSTSRQYFSGDRFNIFAQRPGNGDAVMFYGHMDTVTPHGKWEKGPFNLFKQGDRLYGLGACDMKGGIAAMLTAANKDKERRVKILLCADEENISQGAWSAIRMKKWFNDVRLIVSCEPGNSVKHTGGANVVGIGRRGRVVIEADVQGISSHAALSPQKGVNAIDEAAKIATAVSTFKLRNHKYLGAENIFVRKMEGDSESALDMPDHAHIEFDIQLVPPSTVQDARARVERMVAELRRKGRLNSSTKVKVAVKKRETPYMEPYVQDAANPRIRKVLRLIKKNLREPVINYASSVADDNVLSKSTRIPIVTIGPIGGNEHGQNEWVSLRSLRELVSIYSAIMREM